jgi:outer membrane lipopolysaccharide assembly protein LptE/RlpB
MSHRLLTATLLAALLGLAGCGGNYKSSDDDYRPLGDPHAEQQRDD